MKIFYRLGELSIGHTVNFLIVYGFEYVLYPFTIWHLGPLKGGAVMALSSLVICLVTLWFYDWSKRDWLGIESIKGLKKTNNANTCRQILAFILRLGEIPAFLALSIYTDPFITTAYMREGAFNGMSRRDWIIFWASWIIGNLGWILIISGGIWFIREYFVTSL